MQFRRNRFSLRPAFATLTTLTPRFAMLFSPAMSRASDRRKTSQERRKTEKRRIELAVEIFNSVPRARLLATTEFMLRQRIEILEIDDDKWSPTRDLLIAYFWAMSLEHLERLKRIALTQRSECSPNPARAIKLSEWSPEPGAYARPN